MASLEPLWFPYRTRLKTTENLERNKFIKRNVLRKNHGLKKNSSTFERLTMSSLQKGLEADYLAVDLNKLPCSNLLNSPFSKWTQVVLKIRQGFETGKKLIQMNKGLVSL